MPKMLARCRQAGVSNRAVNCLTYAMMRRARIADVGGGAEQIETRRETRGRVYGPVTFSSRKSGCCMRVNSTAKPPSIWRTTRLGVLPSVIRVPASGI